MFEPTKQAANVVLFAHMVDSGISTVLARNDSDRQIKIPQKLRLGAVTKLTYKNCFQTDLSHEYAATFPPKESLRWLKKAFAVATEAPNFSVPSEKLTDNLRQAVALIDANENASETTRVTLVPSTGIEECLPNGVTVYGDDAARRELSSLVDEFPTLWVDDGFVDVPKEEWMKLPLKSDWES